MSSRVHASTCTHVCMHTPWDRDHFHTPLTQGHLSTCTQLTPPTGTTDPLQSPLPPARPCHARPCRHRRSVAMQSEEPLSRHRTYHAGGQNPALQTEPHPSRYRGGRGGRCDGLGKSLDGACSLCAPFLGQEEMGELSKPVAGGQRTPGRAWRVSLECGEHLQGRRCWVRRGGEEGAELEAASTQVLAGERTCGHFPWVSSMQSSWPRLYTERPLAAMTPVVSG